MSDDARAASRDSPKPVARQRDPILFPSADHLVLERPARRSTPGPASPGSVSLADSHRGDTPDALAPLFSSSSADAPKDADKQQLVARVALLEQELEVSDRKRIALERYACETELRRKKLHDENLRLARQVSELQQWKQDNSYRPFTNDGAK